MSRQITQRQHEQRRASGRSITYREGYKYQLSGNFDIDIGIKPKVDIHCGEYLRLTTDGVLHIGAGYAWDGPSGPTVDTKNFMRGSLVHDALYQLLRWGLLQKGTDACWAWDHERFRLFADDLLRFHCLQDGMSRPRAWWVYQGVRKGGKSSAAVGIRRSVVAP